MPSAKRPSARPAQAEVGKVKRIRKQLKKTVSKLAKGLARSKPITKATRKPVKVRWPPPAERVKGVLDGLDVMYPEVECELHHRNAFELLIATILSAQTTDERVNQTTPRLFQVFPNARAMAEAPQEVLEDLVKSTGFFRQKAKSIKETSRLLVERHGGDVPRDFDALLDLRGVARKTANVVLGTAYGIAHGVVVDTHVQRLSMRLGLTRDTTPEKIEQDLMRVIPRESWIRFSHQLIWHGRRVCFARKPACDKCHLAPVCPSAFKEI